MSAGAWEPGDRKRRDWRSMPAHVLARVDARCGRRCVWCVQDGLETPPDQLLTLEHLQPISRGGDNSPQNLAWACEAHNYGRGNRQRPPEVPTWARRK